MTRRRRSSLQGFSDINITPLMDLTFLLLIVFIITAPLLEYTVNVSPPQMNAERPDEKKHVLITLDAAGQIVLERRSLDLAELLSRLVAIHVEDADIPVLIRADEQRPYREVIEIMRTVRAAELVNVSLVTQPEE